MAVIAPSCPAHAPLRKGKPAAGQITLRREFAGKIALLSFIYTRCPDPNGCPLATGRLFDVFDVSAKSPSLARNAKLVTLSFDPRRDTPETMRDYGRSALEDEDRAAKMDWAFLTTPSPEALRPILEAYGQTIGLAGGAQAIKHVLRVYLIDRRGRVRNVYGLGFLDPRLLLAGIETLLMEEARNKGS